MTFQFLSVTHGDGGGGLIEGKSPDCPLPSPTEEYSTTGKTLSLLLHCGAVGAIKK